MFTRRSIAGLFGVSPFVANSVVTEAMTTLSRQSVYAITGEQSGPQIPNKPNGPIIPEQEAYRLLLKDPEFLQKFTSHLYKTNREVLSIDPDLMVYKSFSPMAKVTFQRQRNVEKYLEGTTSEPSWLSMNWFHDQIKRLMWGK